MKSLPLTNKTKPGGRDREDSWPMNKFGRWLMNCNMTPEQIADELSHIVGTKVSKSAIYNLRNSRYRPGRDLAIAIESLTKNECPASMWADIALRPRGS